MSVRSKGGTLLSVAGWGEKAALKKDGMPDEKLGVPQLWLCGDGFGFPTAVQRTEIETGRSVRFLRRGGRTVASLYEDDDAEYALLLGVLPSDPTAAPEKQTYSAFEELEAVLGEAGMTFADVARTWLYEDRILDWYDGFNKARDAFFRSRHLYDGLVPASTGIGSANVWGAAIATGAIAFKAKRPGSIAMKEASNGRAARAATRTGVRTR